MDAPQDQCYTNPPEHIPIVFDIRLPGVAESLDRQRAVWRGHGEIEALDRDHFVLSVRPGGARELAR